MRRACLPVVVCLGLVLCAVQVGAQAAPAVSVSVDPCVPVDHEKLQKLLAIELGSEAGQGPPGGAATHVQVGCTLAGIELRLEDAVTRKAMSRTLPASSFADASSTRLLALAISEFVVASWIELSVQPEPSVEPIGPRPTSAARRAAQSVVAERMPQAAGTLDPYVVSAGPALQLWSSHDAALFGAGLRLLAPLSGAFVWTLSGDLGVASTEVSLGRVEVMTMSAALAIALRLRADEVAFYVGPGARFGVARIAGEAEDRTRERGKAAVGAYGGPIALSRVEVRAAERVRVGLDLELGLTTLPVRTDTDADELVLELDGVWFESVLSAGFAF